MVCLTMLLSACDLDFSPSASYPAPTTALLVSTLAAYPAPTTLSRANRAARIAQDVVLTTSDGVKLAATLYTLEGSRKPAALLLHVAWGSRRDWEEFAQRLNDAGFVALAVDFRGHGDSGGEKEWGKLSDDAAAAWTFLSEQASVDAKRVVVGGASVGANVALNFAAKQPNVKAVGLLSPSLDYYGIQTESAMKSYGKRPILMFSSAEDEYSVESQKQLERLIGGPKQVQLFQNAGHGTDMLKHSQVADALLRWIKSVGS